MDRYWKPIDIFFFYFWKKLWIAEDFPIIRFLTKFWQQIQIVTFKLPEYAGMSSNDGGE
jgi:hypothetical protein